MWPVNISFRERRGGICGVEVLGGSLGLQTTNPMADVMPIFTTKTLYSPDCTTHADPLYHTYAKH